MIHPSDAVTLAKGVHVVPEFLGNRAPLADPNARAIICGLDMSRDLESLFALYVAGLCGIGYGLRHIIEAQTSHGVVSKNIVISGGAGQHPLVQQILADTCEIPIVITQCTEPVLLGAAILGAVAANISPSVSAAMQQFTHIEKLYHPKGCYRSLHNRRYETYKNLQYVAKSFREH